MNIQSNILPVLVCGQPRSGTSMLMRVLYFGGVDIDYSPQLNSVNRHRIFGNPHGFFELKGINSKKTFKVLSPKVLAMYPDNRVIFMDRDPEQIYKSWENIRIKSGRDKPIKQLKMIIKHRDMFLEEIKKHEHIIIRYNDLQNSTRIECERIKEFLKYNCPFEVNKAIQAVDNTLWIER